MKTMFTAQEIKQRPYFKEALEIAFSDSDCGEYAEICYIHSLNVWYVTVGYTDVAINLTSKDEAVALCNLINEYLYNEVHIVLPERLNGEAVGNATNQTGNVEFYARESLLSSWVGDRFAAYFNMSSPTTDEILNAAATAYTAAFLKGASLVENAPRPNTYRFMSIEKFMDTLDNTNTAEKAPNADN